MRGIREERTFRESDPEREEEMKNTATAGDREILLRSYLERLTAGEPLEEVRKDFAEQFREVDALEIANAEQHLIKSGVPYTEVQKLCDVHSALFHGTTEQERLRNAEKTVAASRESAQKKAAGTDRKAAESKAAQLVGVEGHPLNVLTLENEAIGEQIAVVRKQLDAGDAAAIQSELEKLRAVGIHYAKKGDVLYTLLKNRYDVTGPSDVMWTVDDEIRDELRRVSEPRAAEAEGWQGRVLEVLKRAEEMLYKEANILFPICVQFFTEEEWREIGRDLKEYEFCLIEEPAAWSEAATTDYRDRAEAGEEREVVFASGHMTSAQIEAVFNTIPMELTFVDHEDRNRYYNDNGEPKLFKRPLSSLDREVYSCHPPKIEPMVRGIISAFKAGKKEKVEVWMNKGGQDVLVSYRAVRDESGRYLGTLECVLNMEFAKEHYGR